MPSALRTDGTIERDALERESMNWNFDELERAQRYKLLVGLVVPRPIALVTTLSAAGVVNAAPFSFFNVLADEPPIVILSIEDREDGRMKDSARTCTGTGHCGISQSSGMLSFITSQNPGNARAAR